MEPETRKRLDDMRRAADAIGRFVDGKGRADFLADELLRAAVYYEFCILGEALSAVRKSEPAVAEQITEFDRIIGFRNQIIHGYAKIDDEITWRVVEGKLPVLRQELDGILA